MRTSGKGHSILAEIAAERGIPEKQLLIEAIEKSRSLDEAATSLTMLTNSLRQQMQKYGVGVEREVRLRVVERKANA